MPDRKIKDVAAFINALRVDADGSTTWFRGHSKASWPLLPGIMRARPGLTEQSALARFKQSAAMLMDRTPSSEFDWTFLMQHYGVPTRLLDWTESPLVALFFAVDNYQKYRNADAAVWCLKPTTLNMNANISNPLEANYIPSFEASELEPYATEKLMATNVALLPVATIATRNNPRIQAQMGTFTIHHTKKVAIEAVGDGSHVTRYIIPNNARETIFKELKLLGLNQFSLFPELTSVGLILREMMA